MQPAESDQETRTALGKAIVIRRTELGLSRNDLRDRTGLSYPYVAELEKGAKRMSAGSLQAVSDALELRPAELLAMADALADDEAGARSYEIDAAALPDVAEPVVEAGRSRLAYREAPASAPGVMPLMPFSDAAPPPPPPPPVAAASGAASLSSPVARDSRWFRTRAVRTSSPQPKRAAAKVSHAPPPESPGELMVPVVGVDEETLRAIVRDELRKAGIEPGD